MKAVIITGANTGIGFATAKKFIENNHHVIIACRNPDKAAKAKSILESIGKGKVDFLSLDLNSLDKVNEAANHILKSYDKIDILVNNAGLMTPDLESTEDGFEKQIGVNYIAHYLWTLKLLPLVKKSDAGRIIHLASLMHLLGSIKLDQFKAKDVKRYNGVLHYGNSKLANLLFSNALAQELKDTNVTSNAIHPGGVDSEIYRELPKYQYKAIKLFLISPQKPANLIYQIALDQSWSKRNGDYVSLQTPAIKSHKAKDTRLAKKLYDSTYTLVRQYLN